MRRVVAMAVAALAVSLGVASLRASAAADEKKPAGGGVEKLSIGQFEEKRKGKDVVVLDVRTPEEFEAGHVPGATNLNFRDEKFAEKVAKLDKEKTYLVYCATGRRSTGATAKMKEAGFGKLYNFTGSMAEWNKAGKPVEKGSERPKTENRPNI